MVGVVRSLRASGIGCRRFRVNDAVSLLTDVDELQAFAGLLLDIFGVGPQRFLVLENRDIGFLRGDPILERRNLAAQTSDRSPA